MTKKHEELVEEILSLYCEDCDYYDSREGCWEPETAQKAYCMPRIKKVITLLRSAVRDGRLDEELGVVGRHRNIEESLSWLLDCSQQGADTFIAVRKEGTGKEEEG